MRIQYNFTHVKSQDQIREYAESRIFKLNKHKTSPIKKVTFSFQSEGRDYKVDLLVEAVEINYHSCVVSKDYFSGLEKVLAKVISQMTKRKAKHQRKKGSTTSKVERALEMDRQVNHEDQVPIYSEPWHKVS